MDQGNGSSNEGEEENESLRENEKNCDDKNEKKTFHNFTKWDDINTYTHNENNKEKTAKTQSNVTNMDLCESKKENGFLYFEKTSDNENNIRDHSKCEEDFQKIMNQDEKEYSNCNNNIISKLKKNCAAEKKKFQDYEKIRQGDEKMRKRHKEWDDTSTQIKEVKEMEELKALKEQKWWKKYTITENTQENRDDHVYIGLKEREKNLIYKKVDEILNLKNTMEDDWLGDVLTEDEKEQKDIKKKEEKKQITFKNENKKEKNYLESDTTDKHLTKENDIQNIHKMKDEGKNKKEKGKKIKNGKPVLNIKKCQIRQRELHNLLKKNKYKLTKCNTRMRNNIYKYLYIYKKTKYMDVYKKYSSINADKKTGNEKIEHITFDVKNEGAYQNLHNIELSLDKEDIDSEERKIERDINFLYTEYFIRRKKVIRLKEIYKYMNRKECEFYLRNLKASNILGVLFQHNPNTIMNDIKHFCFNNNMLCLCYESTRNGQGEEIHVFSFKGLNLNGKLFFKNMNKVIEEEDTKRFIEHLLNEGSTYKKYVEINLDLCLRTIIRNEKFQKIRNIHINAQNRLCIVCMNSVFIYDLIVNKTVNETSQKDSVIHYKHVYTYSEKNKQLSKENDIFYAVYEKEKTLIYYTNSNIIYLNNNSNLFQNVFTIVKDISFKCTIFNISFLKNFQVISFSNKVSVMKDHSLLFHVEFDNYGGIRNAETTEDYYECVINEKSKCERREKKREINEEQVKEKESNEEMKNTRTDKNVALLDTSGLCIPFLCLLENEEYCVGYNNVLFIVTFHSQLKIKKKIVLKYPIYYLNSWDNNILVIYDKRKLYVYQLIETTTKKKKKQKKKKTNKKKKKCISYI